MEKKEETKDYTSSEEEDLDYKNSGLIKCRFYRQVVPEKDDLVMCEISKIHEMGAYVTLLEYNNIEGLILWSQVTSKRVKSVNRFLKAGTKEMLEVLRVDEDKMCIDLSKKQIKPETMKEANKYYKKSKKVHAIMRQTAIKLQTPVEELYEKWGWDLYDNGQFPHALDAFRIAME